MATVAQRQALTPLWQEISLLFDFQEIQEMIYIARASCKDLDNLLG